MLVTMKFGIKTHWYKKKCHKSAYTVLPIYTKSDTQKAVWLISLRLEFPTTVQQPVRGLPVWTPLSSLQGLVVHLTTITCSTLPNWKNRAIVHTCPYEAILTYTVVYQEAVH
jgi:hypothetical protein